MSYCVSQGIGGVKQVLLSYFDEAFKSTFKILKQAKSYKEIKVSATAGSQAWLGCFRLPAAS